MIKKTLLGLGLLVLGFINFSNSGYIRQIGTLAYSPYDNNLDVVTLNKGSFLTNKLGVGKDVFYYQDSSDRSIYIFWGNLNGTITPYYMFKSSVFNEQGFFTKYAVCDELTGESLNAVFPGNCSITDYNSSSIPGIKNLLLTVNSEDFYYFNFSSFASSYGIDMCISSSEIGKSICFSSCNVTNKDYYSCTAFGTYYLPSGNYGEYRTGSLNISPGFDNLPIDLLYSSPAVDGSINGSINGGVTENIFCPTIQQLINDYNSKGYNSGLCYSSDRIFNGSSFVSVQPQSIFDLFSSKEDYLTAFQAFSTYCESSVYNPSVCVDYFSGQDLRFNIISKLPKDLEVVGGRKQLYTYCNFYNYDPNATTCVASGVTADFGTEITNQDVIHSLANGQYTVVSPVTNNTEYNTVFNDGSSFEYTGDIITNIQQLFGKFTSLFKQQTGNTSGILPLWILIPFIIIVLFKLFKH